MMIIPRTLFPIFGTREATIPNKHAMVKDATQYSLRTNEVSRRIAPNDHRLFKSERPSYDSKDLARVDTRVRPPNEPREKSSTVERAQRLLQTPIPVQRESIIDIVCRAFLIITRQGSVLCIVVSTI